MLNRRGLPRVLVAATMALAVVMGSVFADELLGVITKVDTSAKKITVVQKGSDEEVTVEVNDDTELVTPKKSMKLNLEKLESRVKKVQEEGKKGIRAKITHEKNVASKIEPVAKKAAPVQ